MAKTRSKVKRKTVSRTRYIPRIIAWETTKKCNLSCTHCRASASAEGAPDELTTAEGRKLLKNFATFGSPVVILTGGEPLLREDIFDLASAGSKLGLIMALATNGTLIDNDVSRKIIDSGIRRTAISIDGLNSATHNRLRGGGGSFDAAIKAASILRRNNIDFQINTSLTAENEGELRQMAGLFEALGACAWHVFVVVPVGRAVGISDNLLGKTRYTAVLSQLAKLAGTSRMQIKPTCAPQYYRIIRQQQMSGGPLLEGNAAMGSGCLAGREFAFVSSSGDVQPCGYFPVIAGSIRKYTFARLWRSSALFLKLRDREEYNGRCGRCEFFDICGGCRARALAVTGDFMDDDPYCSHLPEVDIA